MEYIIEDANIVKFDKAFVTSSMLIKHNKIQQMKVSELPSDRITRMNLSSYVMTPGHVMLVDNLPPMTFPQFKTFMKEQYLNKGCTTLVSIFTVKREREFMDKMKEARSRLLNSPIDYYFAVRIPLKKLTPSFVRLCKRHKIPAVFLEMDDETSFQSVPWGWIKEALYQFPITFLPCWQNTSGSKKFLEKKWKDAMKQEKIPHLSDCPEVGTPLGIGILMKIGIYPTKGELRVGGELDYNLYISPESRIIETIEDLDYDSHIPEVTVHRGSIIKVGDKVIFRPGFGNECTVTIPGHFLLG